MSETALAKIDGVAVERVVGERLQMMQQALADETATRALVKQYVKQHMQKGTDFGEIPGTDKPTLLKPGAEKLVDLFRASPMFELVKSEEDFDRGFGFFNYIFKVTLASRTNPSEVLAVGFGSANSREGRYRWRNGNLKCPECGKEALFKSKKDPEFYCWTKKGGCGAKFKLTEPRVTSQVVGKVENDDVATLANTVLKMAKKRALVDGAIALARCSDLFTQDVEDMQQHGEPPQEEEAPPPRRAPRSESARAAEPHPPQEPNPAPPILDNPFRALQAAMHQRGVPPTEWGEVLKSRRGRTSAKSVTAEDVAWMENYFDGTLSEPPQRLCVCGSGEPLTE